MVNDASISTKSAAVSGGTSMSRIVLRLYSVLLLLIGLALIGGGGYLASLGGSFYYLVSGSAVLVSGLMLWQRRAVGATIYGLTLAATFVWAIWEVGVDGWALLPRVVAPTVLALVLLIPGIRQSLLRRLPAWPRQIWPVITITAAVSAVALRILFCPYQPTDPLEQTGTISTSVTPVAALHDNESGDWTNYGNNPEGTRYSPLTQITTGNVAALKLAWMFNVGVSPISFEATPLKIGQTLYFCTSENNVIALDAETGSQVWRFNAHADASHSHPHPACRGVAYYRNADSSGACVERIFTNTIDGRLIAMDAHDGAPCEDFGEHGEVSLLQGMGEATPGYYAVSSAPTIVQGKVILGGWVMDNQFWGEPSGVIRAYDAVTGKLAWAWDMGRPDRQGEPSEGETFTRSTPNAWAPMSVDEQLGLVYVPTGNATPDYFGADRRPFDDHYSSSVVALDVTNGRPRWSFQTAHHDLWDYDVAAQPTLVDYSTPTGVVKALLQATKRGELFLLDRATGDP